MTVSAGVDSNHCASKKNVLDSQGLKWNQEILAALVSTFIVVDTQGVRG